MISTAAHEPGKKYKIDVKVDVDGDGTYDDKLYVVQHRAFLHDRPADRPIKRTTRKSKTFI